MPAMADKMDDEEAAAWAAMREAFADDGATTEESAAPAPSAGMKGSEEEAVAMDAVREAFGEGKVTPPWKASKAPKSLYATKAAKAPPSSGGAEAREAAPKPVAVPVLDQDWLQSQVDRTVGEVQRLVRAPFPPSLLNALWRLPLEDQNDVLLGASGLEGGILETPAERARRIWTSIREETTARLGGEAAEEMAAAGAPVAAAAPARKKVARTSGPAAAAAGRGRSRSRSPSL
mmetsp:Transcript_72315/g.234934  ORF Transcript_72315/g.234934 Transcript_72315/m.234934 type:complete len:233 (+) Transcript_72315:72-770(+)